MLGFLLERLGKLPVGQAKFSGKGVESRVWNLDLQGVRVKRENVDLVMKGFRLPKRLGVFFSSHYCVAHLSALAGLFSRRACVRTCERVCCLDVPLLFAVLAAGFSSWGVSSCLVLRRS